MVVGIVRIELHVPAAQSLKDKRQVVRSLKQRIRDRVGAAVAEVDHHDLWQRTAIGLAVVAADGARVREQLADVRRLVDHTFEAQVLDWQEDVR